MALTLVGVSSRGLARKMMANYSLAKVSAYLMTVGEFGAPNRADQPVVVLCTVSFGHLIVLVLHLCQTLNSGKVSTVAR